MKNYLIRCAEYKDLPQLTEIYNQAILRKCCTGDTKTFSIEERKTWFEEHKEGRFPLYVYEIGDIIAGYAYLSPYRAGRPALQQVCEVSYYLSSEYQHQGIGSTLLQFMINEARNLGFLNIFAIILDCNISSKALLKKFAFNEWGNLPNIATIEDKEYSHLYYGLRIAD